jgi:electron transport complex protein RnfA
MKELFAILMGGVLLNNYALQSFLGVSTLLGGARDTKKSAAMGAGVTVVMVLSGILCWLVDTFVLDSLKASYLQPLIFTALILAVASAVGALVKIIFKKPLGLAFPLLALNSAVLGVAVNNAGYTFLQALVSSAAVGIGFTLAMVLFCGIRAKINEKYVPAAFRGLPIYLMAASILALTLFAF